MVFEIDLGEGRLWSNHCSLLILFLFPDSHVVFHSSWMRHQWLLSIGIMLGRWLLSELLFELLLAVMLWLFLNERTLLSCIDIGLCGNVFYAWWTPHEFSLFSLSILGHGWLLISWLGRILFVLAASCLYWLDLFGGKFLGLCGATALGTRGC